eukprot:gene12943-biopygen2249
MHKRLLSSAINHVLVPDCLRHCRSPASRSLGARDTASATGGAAAVTSGRHPARAPSAAAVTGAPEADAQRPSHPHAHSRSHDRCGCRLGAQLHGPEACALCHGRLTAPATESGGRLKAAATQSSLKPLGRRKGRVGLRRSEQSRATTAKLHSCLLLPDGAPARTKRGVRAQALWRAPGRMRRLDKQTSVEIMRSSQRLPPADGRAGRTTLSLTAGQQQSVREVKPKASRTARPTRRGTVRGRGRPFGLLRTVPRSARPQRVGTTRPPLLRRDNAAVGLPKGGW